MPTKTPRIAVLNRRRQVAELILRGWTQQAIAAHLKAGQATISRDLREIGKEWRASAVRDFDAERSIVLHKIASIESAAWDAWDKSRTPHHSVQQSTDGDLEKTRRTVAHRDGDTRFLAIVQRCIEQRRAVLGLDSHEAVDKQEPPVVVDRQESERFLRDYYDSLIRLEQRRKPNASPLAAQPNSDAASPNSSSTTNPDTSSVADPSRNPAWTPNARCAEPSPPPGNAVGTPVAPAPTRGASLPAKPPIDILERGDLMVLI